MRIEVVQRETQAGRSSYSVYIAEKPSIDICLGDRYVRKSNGSVETVFEIEPNEKAVFVWTANSRTKQSNVWLVPTMIEMIEDGRLVREQFVTQEEECVGVNV